MIMTCYVREPVGVGGEVRGRYKHLLSLVGLNTLKRQTIA